MKDFFLLAIDEKRQLVLKLLYSAVYSDEELSERFFNTLKRDGLEYVNYEMVKELREKTHSAGWVDYTDKK